MPKVDFSHYEGGREHTYVKHYLLEKYLSRWGYKIGSTWDTLVFIDGFAGPWGAKDQEFADASFGIAIKALNDAVDGLLKLRQRSVLGVCVFVEKAPQPFKKLDEFAKSHSTNRVLAMAFKGRFVENIRAIEEYVASAGANPFKFVFLDQKGWAATPMKELRPFVSERPCELLFNLMTSFLTRFVDRDDLAPSYQALYLRPRVLDRIRALPKGTGQREEAAVEEYCKSLREVCGFLYVSQAVIMDAKREKVRYYLVFATRSLHGIEVFKSAEAEAAATQDEVRHGSRIKREGPFLPFGGPTPKSPRLVELHQRYAVRMRETIIQLLSSGARSNFAYDHLYGEAMAFPLVTADDLEKVLRELEPGVKIELEGKRRKKPLLFKNDRVLVIDAKTLK
ncbi:MAG: three-Cys-motif partner protein TcmP [Pyrinomonadaceae bacterium]